MTKICSKKHSMLVDEKTLLNRLRAIRENAGISQGDMAFRMNLTQASYGRIENGKRSLKYKSLIKMMEILNLDDRIVSSQSQMLNENTTPYKNALQLAKESLESCQEKVKLLEQTILDKNEIISILKSK